jgi:hypothetical protein
MPNFYFTNIWYIQTYTYVYTRIDLSTGRKKFQNWRIRQALKVANSQLANKMSTWNRFKNRPRFLLFSDTKQEIIGILQTEYLEPNAFYFLYFSIVSVIFS